MEAALKLGPFTVGWYGVIIALAAMTAIAITFFEAKRRGEDTDHVLNIAIITIPLGIIGARLYHVIDLWDFYRHNLPLIFSGRGLGIFGALLGGGFGLFLYTRWKKLPALRWCDIVAPSLILAQAIGRWGNYFNQELYGYPTDLPWGIYIDPAHRLSGYAAFSHFHPLFLYESLWNLLGFSLLMVVGRKFRKQLLEGEIFFLYIIYYGIGRFFLEGFKIDVWTVFGVATARWISGIAIITAITDILYRRYRSAPKHIKS